MMKINFVKFNIRFYMIPSQNGVKKSKNPEAQLQILLTGALVELSPLFPAHLMQSVWEGPEQDSHA
jgi:hypothetical protein